MAFTRADYTRIALAIYAQDGEFASTFHRDPMLRHESLRLPAPSDDELFTATSSADWIALIRSRSQEPATSFGHLLHNLQPEHSYLQPLPQEMSCKDSRFTCYIILHGIAAGIMEQSDLTTTSVIPLEKYEHSLMCWYHAYAKSQPLQYIEPLGLNILFHEVFMSSMVDLNLLERAIGRDGSKGLEEARDYVRTWSTTSQAQRCLIHASMIYRHAASMRIDDEPAVHVPRCMFHGAIVWYCFVHFAPADFNVKKAQHDASGLFEAKYWDTNPVGLRYRFDEDMTGRPRIDEVGTLCALTSLLHRIGRCGISKKYGGILSCLIYSKEVPKASDDAA